MDNEKSDINPYAAPTVSDLKSKPGGRSTFVPQIRIAAICMIIQAMLELLFSGYLIAMSFFMNSVVVQQQQNSMPPEQQEMIENVFFFYFGIGGGLVLIIGVLRLVAGILGVMYRGRTLGLVTHFLGLVSMLTCYCLPTAIGVCVYGCVVYFNSDVAHAFKMRAEGNTVQEINEFFLR